MLRSHKEEGPGKLKRAHRLCRPEILVQRGRKPHTASAPNQDGTRRTWRRFKAAKDNITKEEGWQEPASKEHSERRCKKGKNGTCHGLMGVPRREEACFVNTDTHFILLSTFCTKFLRTSPFFLGFDPFVMSCSNSSIILGRCLRLLLRRSQPDCSKAELGPITAH